MAKEGNTFSKQTLDSISYVHGCQLYLIQAHLMERLSTLGIITYLIRNGTIKVMGITDPTVHTKVLQKKSFC